MLTTFIVEAQDSFTLLREVEWFRPKQAHVQCLTLADRKGDTPSRMSIVVDVDAELGVRRGRNLWKLIDVSSVSAVRDVEIEEQTA